MSFDAEAERARLQHVADTYTPFPVDEDLMRFFVEQLVVHRVGTRCLDVGSRGGIQTAVAVENFDHVTCLDAVGAHVSDLQRRFPTISTAHTLIEEYDPPHPFDTILHVGFLEHVNDPVLVLGKCREWLAPGGVVLVGVPNADSLHRQAGVAMGLLPTTTSLSERDHEICHRRVYTWETLAADARAAGLTCQRMWGGFLKPLSSSQIQRDWSPELVDAYKALGDRYPMLCNFILAAFTPAPRADRR